MGTPFVGEIRAFALGYVPTGWLACDGSALNALASAINGQLFSLLGYQYGGSGTTFNLPDLRGRVPVYESPVGTSGGYETVALTESQMPAHAHGIRVSNTTATRAVAAGNYPAVTATDADGHSPQIYANAVPATALASTTMGNGGAGAGHNNIQPSLVVLFCICATAGSFPSH